MKLNIFNFISLLIILLVFGFIIFYSVNSNKKRVYNLENKTVTNYDLRNYYFDNTYKDTDSQNVVTGIYLDYRLYDTLFESLLLVVTVMGIRYLNKRDV